MASALLSLLAEKPSASSSGNAMPSAKAPTSFWPSDHTAM